MEAENERARIGDNSGATAEVSALARVDQIIEVAQKWVTERAEITDQEMADKAGAFVRQGRHADKVLDEERIETNEPFRRKIEANNKIYNDKRAILAPLVSKVAERLNVFFTKQAAEKKRIEGEARQVAEAAAAAAEAARRAEEELLAKADAGEAGGEFSRVAETIQSRREAEQNQKQAERDLRSVANTKVKAGGEHFIGDSRRSLSQRVIETPIVTNPGLVLRTVGTNDGINAELIKAARAYKKLKKKWPAGITIETSTKV